MANKVVMTPQHIQAEIADLLDGLKDKIEHGAGGPWEVRYDLLTLLRRLAFIESGGVACQPTPHVSCDCPNVLGRPLSRIKIAQPGAGFIPAEWERIAVLSDDVSQRNTIVRGDWLTDLVAGSLESLLWEFELRLREVDIPPNNLLLLGGPSVVQGERTGGGQRTKYLLSFVLHFRTVDLSDPPWHARPRKTPNTETDT